MVSIHVASCFGYSLLFTCPTTNGMDTYTPICCQWMADKPVLSEADTLESSCAGKHGEFIGGSDVIQWHATNYYGTPPKPLFRQGPSNLTLITRGPHNYGEMHPALIESAAQSVCCWGVVTFRARSLVVLNGPERHNSGVVTFRSLDIGVTIIKH